MRIDKFDGKDFSIWKMYIKDNLYQKDLYQPLSEKKLAAIKDKDWATLDRKGLGVVRLTLSKSVAFNVNDIKTTVGLIKTLSDMYEKPYAVNKVYLMRHLFELAMIDGESAADFINEFSQIISQLASVKIIFEDEVKSLIFFFSLPKEWETVVAAVSNSIGKEALKLDDVRDLVVSESTRIRIPESHPVEHIALRVEGGDNMGDLSGESPGKEQWKTW